MADKRRSPRARNALLRRVVVSVVLTLGVAALVFAFLPEPLAVDVGQVERRTLLITVDEDGKTRVKDAHRYVVSAPLLGTFARSTLQPGDAVTLETVVARLLPLAPPLLDARTRAEATGRVSAAAAGERQAQTAVERARVAHELATAELLRLRGLRTHGAVSERELEVAELQERTRTQELASARLATKVATHELTVARAALGFFGQSGPPAELELRSPVAGRVLRVFQQSESVVQPGTPLIELGDPAALEISTLVLTSDAIDIAPGAAATIEHWGGDKPLRAHVQRIEPSAVTRVSALGVEEQRVNVLLELDAPRSEWPTLGDGYRVEARIVVWEGQGRLMAPASAVFRRDGGHALFAVEAERAVPKRVEVGRRNDEWVEITKGIDAGTRVILHPSDRVVEGVRVVPR